MYLRIVGSLDGAFDVINKVPGKFMLVSRPPEVASGRAPPAGSTRRVLFFTGATHCLPQQTFICEKKTIQPDFVALGNSGPFNVIITKSDLPFGAECWGGNV